MGCTVTYGVFTLPDTDTDFTFTDTATDTDTMGFKPNCIGVGLGVGVGVGQCEHTIMGVFTLQKRAVLIKRAKKR